MQSLFAPRASSVTPRASSLTQGDARRVLEQLSRSAGPARTEFPPFHVYANSDEAIIAAEIPGVKPEDLDVSVHRDSVAIKFERRLPEDEGRNYHRRERPVGRFARIMPLPFVVDTDKVEGNLKNGVLTIRLERADEDKPRRIKLKS